jgi:protein-L-isoaspartate O-methyltransferase
VPELSDHFEQLLKPKGRLFIIVGSPTAPIMQAMLVTRESNKSFSRVSLFETEGLPLTLQSDAKAIVKEAFLL